VLRPALSRFTCVLGTSGTGQVALVKLTCHSHLRPLYRSLDKRQLVKSTWITWQETACQVKLKGDPPKVTCTSCLKIPQQGSWRGGSGHGHGQKKKSKSITFLFYAILNIRISIDCIQMEGLTSARCIPIPVVSVSVCACFTFFLY